jgi:ClpP class serine protease
MFPESVLTMNMKGETEVRRLIDKGRFVRYDYIYPKTGKQTEKGKLSIILRNDEGKEEHLFLIPVKGGRFLAVIPKDEKKNRRVWNGKKARDLF